ncbi:hypothetical protein AAFF_G00157960 [Aldrovandia affinis]|uniref:Uncharacterized protein n=1 Tax=Aldrovandia affinis TaxID=143900 RepID=A0AAD7W8G1_9TELE|nr:hypothetical protein AAFF_G00157960 [Aldrovandia affinis]
MRVTWSFASSLGPARGRRRPRRDAVSPPGFLGPPKQRSAFSALSPWQPRKSDPFHISGCFSSHCAVRRYRLRKWRPPPPLAQDQWDESMPSLLCYTPPTPWRNRR